MAYFEKFDQGKIFDPATMLLKQALCCGIECPASALRYTVVNDHMLLYEDGHTMHNFIIPSIDTWQNVSFFIQFCLELS